MAGLGGSGMPGWPLSHGGPLAGARLAERDGVEEDGRGEGAVGSAVGVGGVAAPHRGVKETLTRRLGHDVLRRRAGVLVWSELTAGFWRCR